MQNRESISKFTFPCPLPKGKKGKSIMIEATYNHSTGLLALRAKTTDYGGANPLARMDDADKFVREHEGNYFYIRDVMSALKDAGVETAGIIHQDGIEEAASSLRDLPPVQWDTYLGGVSGAYKNELSMHLQQEAIDAIRLAAYVNSRALGDTHNSAVDVSNRSARAAAKALGFSYPKSFDLTF